MLLIDMKRFLIILFFIFYVLVLSAQIQQGIVKTRGRMLNGKLVRGVRLSGVTIKLNYGNPLISGNQGTFSFNVPATKSFSLLSVSKKGYTLADPDDIKRTFFYSSSNPFFVVLEDEKQHQAELNIATRNIRRILNAQLQAREDEIDSLKNENLITEEEYQKKLKELNDKMSNSNELIKGLAKRFVSTDFDRLDSLNAQISYYIQIGDLFRADSLIKLQGNLDENIEKFRQHKSALVEAEEYIRREQKNIAKRIKNKIDIALLSYNEDDIAKYSFALADLDTTCAEYQSIALSNIYYRYDLDIARLYDRLINIATIDNTLLVQLYRFADKAESYYFYKGNLQGCKDLYDKIITIAEKRNINLISLKQSYRWSKIYFLYNDYKTMLRIHKIGISEYLRDTTCDKSVLSREYGFVAQILCLMGEYKEAISYYEKAILQMESTKSVRYYKYSYLFYIAYAYEKLGREKKAKKFYKESFTILYPSKDCSHYSIMDYKKNFEDLGFGVYWLPEILLEVCDNYIESSEYALASEVCDKIESICEFYDNYGQYETPYTIELAIRRNKIKYFFPKRAEY